ncbi:MAG: MFS transporter [Butyrivibrio sp.]|uniref:MFS transporter n=1 Tax=Butyrivibrio sp. TaxID=28121 RepID=UPI0025E7CECC|nr:MFS transporter [Butyrivibrio sp.]MCR5770612.1 MFS transporter [Butyrivibrio sp.]
MNTEEKESRQLLRLNKEASRKKPLHYIGVAMILLTIIYIVDEITSNMNAAMQPYVLFDLFNISSRNVNTPEYTKAFNVVAPIQVFSNLLLIITPFYKALSDKYGRKLFLMINTVGMGIGMCIVMTSQNVAWYILGMLFMMFFTPNDMQVLYIMETAPKQKRATYSFIAKGIALVSVSLIGVFSRIFLNDNEPSSWRLVYAIPVVSAIVIGLLSYLFMHETPVFLEQRMGYLSLTKDEREKKLREDKEKGTSEEGGVFRAIRFIFTNKQLRWIFIAGFIFFATTFYTSYYATVLEGAMSTDMVATALVIYPFFNGLVTILSGFFSDKLGRKKVCLILGSVTIIGLLMFVLSCRLGLGPIAAGIAYGCSIGGLWSMSDTLILTMPAESSPSGMRSSVMGTISVLIGAGMFLGQTIFIVCQNFLPMDVLFMIICLPFMVLSLIILITKVKETKDADLDNITADTYK